MCVFGVNTTPSLYHSAPMFCVSPQQLYIVQNHAPQHHTHRGSLAARGLRSIGVFGSTLRCLETNAFLQKLLAGSIYPGGGPQVSVEIPGDLKMQAGDPGGDEDFPSCVGGVDPTYMGFFCSYHPGKKYGLCNHLQIFSYTSLFLYSDHVVFDTCVRSPLYAQIHLDLHTNIVVCNAAECTYASRSAYAYRRLRVYTVYSMECKNSECIIWGT